jgi:phosphotransferase system enzyme I (PtsI)
VRVAGIAASPGIGIGPVYRYEREELAVRDTPVAPERVEEELRRYRQALEQSRRDLIRVRDGIAAELGEHEARIYDAHILMLEDPEMLSAVERAVRGEGRNAAFAFRRYMGSVAAQFETVEDEYLRERRADVLDVERRVLRALLGDSGRGLAALREPAIIVAHDLGPSEIAQLDRTRVLGFVTEVGGRTSHGAIVARGRGIPAVVAAHGAMQHARSGDPGMVDGYVGHFEIRPDAETEAHYRARRARLEEETTRLEVLRGEPAVTPDGRRLELGANMELPMEVENVLASGADGVGLYRTEFFYLDRYELPGEEEQYAAYRDVAERLHPRPVIYRTMDLGGDKVASYLGMTHETNPFLGWRGIRFALHHPDLFRTQIRAIYRASAHGRGRIMFPMVSSEDELVAALDLCAEVRADLASRGVPHDPDLETGVMIETPSSVWMADALARRVKFLSIGTNDLTQYTLAIDRDNPRLAHLYEPLDPAVLRSIRHTVDAGHDAGCWVGVCGEMAADPATAVLLLGLGIDEVSMSSFDVPRVKAAVRDIPFAVAEQVAAEALRQSCARGVRDLVAARIEVLLPPYLLARRGAE